MAKQPETLNRFRIFADVSVEQLGHALVQLAELGFEGIGHELITDVANYKTKARKQHDTSGDEFATQWLTEHPTFRVIDLVNHFRNGGRTPASAYRATHNLVDSGVLIKIGTGMYRRADVKEIAPPKGDGQRTRPPTTKYEVPNKDLILKATKSRKRITVKEMGELLESHGRNKRSASPIINVLVKAKVIRSIEPGVYEVLKNTTDNTDKAMQALPKVRAKMATDEKRERELERKRKYRERKKAARLAALNGSSPATSETTHG